ncbi:MAG: histidine kinase [Bacteroidetes bacterium GWA2_30_7]|nr:MAG: histidine kinase [Bacteroidetes bacterium GWA2_30_7]
MKPKLKSILLIDDDDATNFYNSYIIKKTEITEKIDVALNGKDAIEFLTNKGKFFSESNNYPSPSLILLDINMPVMNGWSFLEEYKKLDPAQKAEIVIVMLTTSLNPDDLLKAESYTDIKEFKNKPLTSEILWEIYDKYFNK